MHGQALLPISVISSRVALPEALRWVVMETMAFRVCYLSAWPQYTLPAPGIVDERRFSNGQFALPEVFPVRLGAGLVSSAEVERGEPDRLE